MKSLVTSRTCTEYSVPYVVRIRYHPNNMTTEFAVSFVLLVFACSRRTENLTKLSSVANSITGRNGSPFRNWRKYWQGVNIEMFNTEYLSTSSNLRNAHFCNDSCSSLVPKFSRWSCSSLIYVSLFRKNFNRHSLHCIIPNSRHWWDSDKSFTLSLKMYILRIRAVKF